MTERSFLVITGFLLILSSCKKDKLEGEYEVLKGTWNWSYTVKFTCDKTLPGFLPNDTIFGENCVDMYTLDFLEKGVVKSIKNGEVKKRKRIVFREFAQIPQSSFDYGGVIHLNGNDNKTLGFAVLGDTLETEDFDFTGLPFRPDPPNDEPGDNLDIFYRNHYVKE